MQIRHSSFKLYASSYKCVSHFARFPGAEAVAEAVKLPHLFRLLNAVFRHVAHHLATRHLAHGSFLDGFAADVFAKHDGQKPHTGRQVLFDAAAVLLRREVDDQSSILAVMREV